jgi:peptidylprolyl isomerase
MALLKRTLKIAQRDSYSNPSLSQRQADVEVPGLALLIFEKLFCRSSLNHAFKTILLTILAIGISLGLGSQPGFSGGQAAQAMPNAGGTMVAYLPPGNAITDGRAILRYALPINSPEIREVQKGLEDLSERLRVKRWGPIKSDITKVSKLLNRKQDKILAAVPVARHPQAEVLLTDLKTGIEDMSVIAEQQDREGLWQQRRQQLDRVTALEELMVEGYPFEVPAEYDHLPQLKGRATIEVTTSKGPVEIVVDGYSAPVTAGNFVDLVQRGFYNGLPFIRAEDFYVLQTGDPEGPDEGFIDPKTGEYRAIPLEILVKGDDQPIYGETLEALGRYLDDPVLPFSAFGTVAMARPESDPNGGSSQFFFFLFEPELTPAGLNLLDGRYAVFGYVIEGKEVLRQLGQGDFVESARVISGAEHLVSPSA